MHVSYVYVIAFRGAEFLMVRHARRAWEMPGGKVNAGENADEAVVREFREETGYDIGSLKLLETEGDGLVYLGEVGRKLPMTPNKDEIAAVAFFKELPEELSFPLVEYERMLDSALHQRGH